MTKGNDCKIYFKEKAKCIAKRVLLRSPLFVYTDSGEFL